MHSKRLWNFCNAFGITGFKAKGIFIYKKNSWNQLFKCQEHVSVHSNVRCFMVNNNLFK